MPAIAKKVKALFDYPDDPMGGVVEVCHLKEGEVQSIIANSSITKIVTDENGEQHREVSNRNLLITLVVASIISWENFYDADGAPLPCTAENKKLFCLEDNFVKFIAECRETLDKQVLEDKQAAEKN